MALLTQGLNLPEKTLTELEVLCERVQLALGEDFVGALLYGSAAREDWVEGLSDINLMIISQRADLPRCAAITAPLRRAQRDIPVHAELITPRDLERSADVFPLKFLDIQRTHHLLAGRDPLADVEIAWDHLRLRVEQQLKSVMFSLRQDYLVYERQPEQLIRTIRRELGAFLMGLGALGFLSDGQWWLSGKEAIAESAVQNFGVEPWLMADLLAIRARKLQPDPERLQQIYAAFMHAAEHLADVVDRLDDEPDDTAQDEVLPSEMSHEEADALGDEALKEDARREVVILTQEAV